MVNFVHHVQSLQSPFLHSYVELFLAIYVDKHFNTVPIKLRSDDSLTLCFHQVLQLVWASEPLQKWPRRASGTTEQQVTQTTVFSASADLKGNECVKLSQK